MGNTPSSTSQPSFKPAQPAQRQKPSLAPLSMPEGVRISDDLVGRVKLSPSGKKGVSGEETTCNQVATPMSQVATPTSQVQVSPKVNIAAELLPRVKTAQTPNSASSPLFTGFSSEQFQGETFTESATVREQQQRVIGTSSLSPRIPVHSEVPVPVKSVDPAYVNSLDLPPEVRSRIESYPC